MKKSENTTWQTYTIKQKDRLSFLYFENKVLWFTGLSGSGKSTIANKLESELNKKKILTYILDGDNIRHGLNSDLGFSIKERNENIRRVGEVTKLFYDVGVTPLVCFISPSKKMRNKIRKLIGKDFIEIYIKSNLNTCEKRDPKGLYKKARKGIIKKFTGISSPYEEPTNPEIIINTNDLNVLESVNKILKYLNLNL